MQGASEPYRKSWQYFSHHWPRWGTT